MVGVTVVGVTMVIWSTVSKFSWKCICILSFVVSNQFGYGLMDADKLVQLAEKWITVPDQHICHSQQFSQQMWVKLETPLWTEEYLGAVLPFIWMKKIRPFFGLVYLVSWCDFINLFTFHWLVDWMADWSVGWWSFDWLVDWLANWWIEPLSQGLFGWLVDWIID